MSATVHLVGAVFLSLYCFLFQKNKFDLVYVAFMYALVLHWCFLNGECILSYHYKKKLNPNYIAGEDCTKNDFQIEYKEYASMLHGMFYIMNLYFMYNIYAILERNAYPHVWSISFILIHEIYYYGMLFFSDHYKNVIFLWLQEGTKYLLIAWGIFFFFFTCKRIWMQKKSLST